MIMSENAFFTQIPDTSQAIFSQPYNLNISSSITAAAKATASTASASMNDRSILSWIHYYMCDIWLENGDKRVTQGQYFISSNGLINTSIIIGVYLLFVTVIGPRMMRNREPMTLKGYLIFHNFAMTLFNLYSFAKSIQLLGWGAELLNFDAPDPNDQSERALNLIFYGQLYLFTKFADLIDTVMMVLRKKTEQLSFLHLYHHSIVPTLGIFCFLLYPTATPVGAFVVLNSMIHTIMYSYYGLAALGPNMRKYLWWKKYITQIQIIQFLVYIIYCGAFFIFQRGYKPGFFIIGATQAPLFMFLFIRFYMRSYRSKKQISVKQD